MSRCEDLAARVKELEAELVRLRAEMRGVFCFTKSVPPSPGPKLDTPQERLRRKRKAKS